MRRKIAMLLCASMAIGLLAGCGGSSEESKASESKEEKGHQFPDRAVPAVCQEWISSVT